MPPMDWTAFPDYINCVINIQQNQPQSNFSPHAHYRCGLAPPSGEY